MAALSGSLIREKPSLPVYVHQFGAPHMADPSKLVASATRLWAKNSTISSAKWFLCRSRISAFFTGGETLEFGSRKLDVVYTRATLRTTSVYFDQQEGVAFVGDTTGVAHR